MSQHSKITRNLAIVSIEILTLFFTGSLFSNDGKTVYRPGVRYVMAQA